MRWLFPLLLLAACSNPAPGGTTPPPACGDLGQPPARPSALEPTAATYLGLGASDAANAVEIAPDCAVVVGGRMGGTEFGQSPTTLLGGTSGAVMRLDPKGQRVLSLTRLGAVVNDLEVRRQGGQIAVAGDFGLALLSPDGKTPLWSVTDQGAADRVAVGDDGTVAALFGKTLRVYDAGGKALGSRSFEDSAVNDVAVGSSARLVFVTGFAQRDGGACSQLQVAWVRAYDYTGQTLRWRAYDWSHAQAAGRNSSCADTRGMRLAMGRDGKLYFAGESAGGNTIYRYDPQDLSKEAPNVKRGPYHDAYNTGANHITYYARLEPADGKPLLGQILLARLPDTKKGNTLRPRAIAADEAGRVYVGGVAACCIADRQGGGLQLNGQPLPDYAGEDAWVLVTSPDFQQDLLWMVWNKGGKGEVRGLAAASGTAALAGRAKGPFHTHQALQEVGHSGANADNSNGYASVWPGWRPAP